MTVSANAVWRVRPSGSNTNGGGFDCSLSSSASGSNGVISGTNTFTDTTAAAFTSGMTGSAINIAGVGQFKFTFVSSTVGTLTIGSSGTLQPIGANGVKFSWTMGAGQDYSQQNTAQATGTLGTASGTTTFTDAGGAFTSAMVGNALWIASGAGFTTGAYFITAFGSSTSVTLDRSPGTGTVAHWAVGGGWADWFTNTTSTGQVVPGNSIFVLGSGTPNPSSYTYDYVFSSNPQLASGSSSGAVIFANDPLTPGYKAAPDATSGMPVTQLNNFFSSSNNNSIQGMWLVMGINQTGPFESMAALNLIGCVLDQFGFSASLVVGNSNKFNVLGCEVFSSISATGASRTGIEGGGNCFIVGCNVHDCTGMGVQLTGSDSLINSIVANNSGDGVSVSTSHVSAGGVCQNNTIDGNTGHGIEILSQSPLTSGAMIVVNNIISNHVGAGKVGLVIDAGTAAQNYALGILDYNTYYNNTSNYSAINVGPHDTALSSTPYVNSSTGNYQLA